MKTLQEEREAIVEEFNKWRSIQTQTGNQITLSMDCLASLKSDVRTALLSHEEKVVARVREMLDEEMEYFADMEHERWSKWQKYMHSRLFELEDVDNSTCCHDHLKILPTELWQRWERQIATPYAELSEAEKESDREQVRPYLNHIKSKLTDLTLPITDEV